MVHAMWCHPDARTHPLQCVGCQFPRPCKHTSWRHVWAADSDGSLNVAQLGRTAINTPPHPTLQHANPTEALNCPLRFAVAYD
jgi:hypothetical protein